jgi:hypothetical protein
MVSIVATAGLALVQVTGKFVNVRPLRFVTIAESANLWLASSVAVRGVTDTVRREVPESSTVTVVYVVFEPEARKIFALPLRCEVTTPSAETVATETSLELHAFGRPPSARPASSCTRAESAKWDFDTTVDVAGSIEIEFATADGADVGTDVIESEAEHATNAVQQLTASRVRRWIMTGVLSALRATRPT